MENIIITCFRGYSQVIGHITLTQFFNQIREGNFRRNIEEIRKAMEEGNTAKADRIKRQLPYFTLTGVYAERRLGSKIDISGSNLAWGMYATHDPEAFYSPKRVTRVKRVFPTTPTSSLQTPR